MDGFPSRRAAKVGFSLKPHQGQPIEPGAARFLIILIHLLHSQHRVQSIQAIDQHYCIILICAAGGGACAARLHRVTAGEDLQAPEHHHQRIAKPEKVQGDAGGCHCG